MHPPWSIATSMMTLPGCIRLKIFAFDQARRFRAWNQHGTDHQIGTFELFANCMAVAE